MSLALSYGNEYYWINERKGNQLGWIGTCKSVNWKHSHWHWRHRISTNKIKINSNCNQQWHLRHCRKNLNWISASPNCSSLMNDLELNVYIKSRGQKEHNCHCVRGTKICAMYVNMRATLYPSRTIAIISILFKTFLCSISAAKHLIQRMRIITI